MDGIFGIGLGEMLVIIIVLLVIGGPENMVKWSREAGRMIRQFYDAVSRLSAEASRELDMGLDKDGKALIDASRELVRGIQDIKSAADPRRIAGQTTKYLKESLESPPQEAPLLPNEQPTPAPLREDKYNDWRPKN
jgi:Sec-independent protein translocase protein TatA